MISSCQCFPVCNTSTYFNLEIKMEKKVLAFLNNYMSNNYTHNSFTFFCYASKAVIICDLLCKNQTHGMYDLSDFIALYNGN